MMFFKFLNALNWLQWSENVAAICFVILFYKFGNAFQLQPEIL